MRDRPASRVPALVALALALPVAGVIGRLTAPSNEPAPPPRPAATPPGAATAVVAGVPVDYTRTRAGAVGAMATYGEALADPSVQLDDRRRHQVAAAVGTARYARALDNAQPVFAARRAGAVGRALRPGAHAVFLGVPVAYRLRTYDAARAVIESWGVAIAASDTGLAPRASWATTTTTAVWQHGDWKVDAVSSRPGPVPSDTQNPSPTAAFIGALAGMRTLRHAP